MVSLNTDIIDPVGPTGELLKRIARAGFTQVHWCHHWTDDTFYSEADIDATAGELAEAGLTLADTHGSSGAETCWYLPDEGKRRAGVELVKNRVHFTHRLGARCVVMHPMSFQSPPPFEAQRAAVEKSLDELEGFCRDRGVRLALENGFLPISRYEQFLLPVIEGRSPQYLGFCWDNGHQNIAAAPGSPQQAREDAFRDRLADRLIAVHLHDNDGQVDRHWIPFTGCVDWTDVVQFLRRANYGGPLTLELSFDRQIAESCEEFLTRAYQAAIRLQGMVNEVEGGEG